LEKDIWAKYQDENVVVVSIATDNMSNAAKFKEEFNLTYPILVDPQGTYASALDVHAYPTNVIVDSTGKIRYLRVGFDPNGILKALDKLTEK